ncbi:MAG: NAD(P)-dependent oxidoreductase, partial [Myxococcales bacterium]|nr:NAD(P)-dependent oxidoreductase [Myxococcales bacterium]
MTIRCGFIGLGIMGNALARNLAPNGLPASVFDLDEEAMAEVAKSGAKPVASPAEIAKASDLIGICVPADDHVRSVLCGDAGVFAHAARGAVVLIHSTIHPETFLEMAELGAKSGIDVLEVPVAGGPVRAAEGNAYFIVAGKQEAIDKAKPYFDALTNEITLAGELGNAAKLKLALNVLTNLSFSAALEGLLLAKAMGLPQELFEEGGQANTMLNSLHLQYLSTRKMPEEAQRSEGLQDYLRGRMEIAQKDLSLALEMARKHGIAMPVTGVVSQVIARIYGVHDD